MQISNLSATILNFKSNFKNILQNLTINKKTSYYRANKFKIFLSIISLIVINNKK